jgi:hypothetical protein
MNHEHPTLSDFLSLSGKELREQAKKWPVGACPAADTNMVAALLAPVNQSGTLFETVLHLPVARVQTLRVIGANEWDPTVPLEIRTDGLVKNPDHISSVQGMVGEHNALVVIDETAYIGTISSGDGVVYVARPIVPCQQAECVGRLHSVIEQLDELKNNT